jgi:WD40 repeat protein
MMLLPGLGGLESKLTLQALTDPTSPNLVIPFSTKQIGNASLAISSSDTILAVGGWDGKVRLFSAASGKPLGTLGYHRETVQCLAFPQAAMSESGETEVLLDPSTIELGEEDSDEDDEPGGRGGGKERWFVSGGKDRRVALWELMDFTRSETAS